MRDRGQSVPVDHSGIAVAAAGDTVLVGPGRYGDLNRNGTLGETQEETPEAGCDCALAVSKGVVLISSDGAAATVIDFRSVAVSNAVVVSATDAEFGRPDHGFTVTNTAASNGFGGFGIRITGTNIDVRGNQVLALDPIGFIGILAVAASQQILIEKNQSIGWGLGNGRTGEGIAVAGADKKVSKNQVSLNNVGIFATGGDIVGNVAVANDWGFVLVQNVGSVTGNAAYSNGIRGFGGAGFAVGDSFNGPMTKNNLFGNFECGLANGGVSLPSLGFNAANNYWGAGTGPGADPADPVCNSGVGAATTATPFQKSPTAVNPQFDP